MDFALVLLLLVIVTALVFEFINGFHDTANSIATVVATKVLTPTQAVMLAAVTNLIGAFWGTAVAKTIASGLVDTDVVHVGSQVLICPWALHRSPGHWQEPKHFDPSRFLGTGSEPAAWLAFGAGPRVCIGRGLAMLEGQIILNAIAQAGRLLLESAPPAPDPGIALRPEGDVWMRFESASH